MDLRALARVHFCVLILYVCVCVCECVGALMFVPALIHELESVVVCAQSSRTAIGMQSTCRNMR